MVGDIRIDAGDFAPGQEPEARIAKCLGCHGKHLAGDIDFGPDVHFGIPALWGMREADIAESLQGVAPDEISRFSQVRMQPDGILTLESPFDFETTVERVSAAIDA